MRWDDLFADLEGQLAAERGAQFQAEVADLTRAERASVELAARLIGARGSVLTITLAGGDRIIGEVRDAASQWVLLQADGRQILIPTHAWVLVAGLPHRSQELAEVQRRLSLGYCLRALSRDRARVRVTTAGPSVLGVIAAVGADHFDLTQDSGSSVTVPFAAIGAISSV